MEDPVQTGKAQKRWLLNSDVRMYTYTQTFRKLYDNVNIYSSNDEIRCLDNMNQLTQSTAQCDILANSCKIKRHLDE